MTLEKVTTAVMPDQASVDPEPPQSSTSKSTIIANIRVITHNIRYATTSPFKGEELWPVWCPHLCSALVFNSIVPETFICLQEVLNAQLEDILGSLNDSANPENKWAYIGVGRDDGKKAGEYSPIFYRPCVWKLKTWETRWMSQTPEVPSKGWDAGNKRIVTIGEFEHVKTGHRVVVMSTHFDNEGANSRRESSKIILERIKYWTEVTNPGAILLGGDFNSPPDDDAYKIMTSADSSMEDIALRIPKEKRYGNELTFSSFGHVDNDHQDRIDFIFSRKGDKVEYNTYAVLANRFEDGVFHSDHRACVTDVKLSS